LLEPLGWIVLIAENGDIAVQLFTTHQDRIELILMDLHMPVKNGYEASSEIRALSPDVPIVAMTADVITGVWGTVRGARHPPIPEQAFRPGSPDSARCGN
jgi:CheY-like chemotaxis protein